MHYQHASYDTVFLVVSVMLSLAGAFAALVSAIRIPLSTGREKWLWTAVAALALGGGAIWSMHFIGMAAYHLGGMAIAYDVRLTVLSFVIAVVTSGLGLAIVGYQPDSAARLVVGGAIAGLGVAAMHYTGMAAMHTGSTVTYNTSRVAISIVIAVVAALAALFIAYRVRGKRHVAAASVVMAAAVCGMHYTGMSATRVAAGGDDRLVSGADPLTLSLIVCVIAFTVLATVIFAALGGMADAGAFQLAAEAAGREAGAAAPVPADPGAPVPAWIAPPAVPPMTPNGGPRPPGPFTAGPRTRGPLIGGPVPPAPPTPVSTPSPWPRSQQGPGSGTWASSGSWVEVPREAPSRPAASRGLADRDLTVRDLADDDLADRDRADRDRADRDQAKPDQANQDLAARDLPAWGFPARDLPSGDRSEKPPGGPRRSG
jgi:NO-binding membrane sensor protein with MHYT domain